MVDVDQLGAGLQSLVHVPKDEETVLTTHNNDALKQRSVEDFGLVTEALQATVGLQVIYVQDLRGKQMLCFSGT